MKLQETPNVPLSDYPIFNGTDVELSRQALSRIFNPIFLEPGKDVAAFQFSVHGVQLPHLWISSLCYQGNPKLGLIEPSDYHTLQIIPSGSFQFSVDGQKISANAAQPLMISNGQQVKLQPIDKSRCLSLVVKDKDLRDLISIGLDYRQQLPELRQ